MAVPPDPAQRHLHGARWTDDRVGDLIRLRANEFPDRELFSFQGRRITYGKFDSWVSRIATDMVEHGVQRGDRVMVQLPNCLEALALQAAAFRIGAIDVPVIPIYREHETAQIVADARPSVIAVSASIGEREPRSEIDLVLEQVGHRPAVCYLVGGEAPGWHPVPEMGRRRSSAPSDPSLPEPAAAGDSALILYTSGTTSKPKGALLSSRALFAHLRNMTAVAELSENSVLLAATPLSHLGGFVAGLLLPAYLGARAVILPSWRPDEAVELIERERVTTMMGATVFLHDLVSRYSHGAAPEYRLPQFMCAGATIPPELIRSATELGVFATRNYGMTETAGICTGATPHDPLYRRSDWDGHILPGMQIQVVDADRVPLPDGQEGEFRIRGPQLFDGYTDSALTASQFDENGWFYPGDIGITDQGWIRMTGRSKDVVNRGGEKLSTQDIEEALASHPDVVAAAVTAVPDDRLGEAVAAWVVLAAGTVWSGPDVYLRHLESARLARVKFPVEWHVVENIPTTASGKVQKFRLHELTDLETATGARFSTTTTTKGACQ